MAYSASECWEECLSAVFIRKGHFGFFGKEWATSLISGFSLRGAGGRKKGKDRDRSRTRTKKEDFTHRISGRHRISCRSWGKLLHSIRGMRGSRKDATFSLTERGKEVKGSCSGNTGTLRHARVGRSDYPGKVGGKKLFMSSTAGGSGRHLIPG